MDYLIINNQWKWTECLLPMKRFAPFNTRESSYLSLKSDLNIADLGEHSGGHQNLKQFIPEFNFAKNFNFQPTSGFSWHKSWYIPELTVKLPLRFQHQIKNNPHIQKITVELTSAFPCHQNKEYYLEEVELQGESEKIYSKRNQVLFTNLKFSQTSFNKNRNKFSLVAIVYITFKKNKEKFVLKSFISTPIHVDSRRQARKKIVPQGFILQKISYDKFQEKLEYEDKFLMSSLNQKGEGLNSAYLYSIPGFLSYYKAPNIRNKIKHPYFLGYKFKNIFKIYFNKEQVQNSVQALTAIFKNSGSKTKRNKDNMAKKQLISPLASKSKFENQGQVSELNIKKLNPKLILIVVGEGYNNFGKQNSNNLSSSSDEFNKFKDRRFESSSSEKNESYQLKNPIPKRNNSSDLFQSDDIMSKQKINGNSMNINTKENFKGQKIITENHQNSSYAKQNMFSMTKQNNQNRSTGNSNQNQSLTDPKMSKSNAFFQSSKNNSDSNQQNKKNRNIETNQQKTFSLKNLDSEVKQIRKLFQNWKFNFVEIKGNYGTIQNVQKWEHIPTEQLKQSYIKFYQNLQQNMGMDIQNSQLYEEYMLTKNSKAYQKYQVHQILSLQKPKIKAQIKQKICLKRANQQEATFKVIDIT